MANSKPILWVSQSAWEAMASLANQSAPKETGGMLLGYAADEAVVVTAIIGPGPNAAHSLFRFRPDHDYQQCELEHHYFATGGRESYLGDWHTHPKGPARMSFLDRLTLTRIARDPMARAPRASMLILVGGRSWAPAGFRVQADATLPWQISTLPVQIFPI